MEADNIDGATDYAESLSESSSSSEEDNDFTTDSSDDSDLSSDFEQRKTPSPVMLESTLVEAGSLNDDYTASATQSVNFVDKLYKRECTGSLLGDKRSHNCQQIAFDKVPKRMIFCLKDVVPPCFLHGHIIMGLSACGQFMLSYTVRVNDNSATNHYSFSIGYKYTLFFLIFQPHRPPRKYYQCCLFDDHGVDSLKKVTMAQWKCSDQRVLIVHGGAEDENEDSYITYVKVPKLNCVECKKLQNAELVDYMRDRTLCLKCNLTVHTKYSTTDSDRCFNAHMNLICPERILIVANGFLHMLHIDLEHPTTNQKPGQLQHCALTQLTPFILPRATPPYETMCDNNNIVARIIADFSDIETDSTTSSGSRQLETSHSNEGNASPVVTCFGRKMYDELILTCNGSIASPLIASATAVASPKVGVGAGAAQVSVISHQRRRQHRIVTKSYRNSVVSVDMQGSSTTPSSTSVVDKANAYEFSEDNEKCEKISTLRKRRLADKKYEFSEDNSENIVPFTKVRSANKSIGSALFSGSPAGGVGHTARTLHRSPAAAHHFNSSPCASPSSSPRPSHASSSGCDSRHCTPPPLHRASPIAALQGFRSPPCSSPVGAAAAMRSPSRHVSAAQIYNQKSPPPPLPQLSQATLQMLSFKPLATLSPLQVSMAKRNHFELSGSMSPNANVPFLSPRREEMRIVEVPLQGVSMSEKPVCTKKFKRRYVEEDDAASVITSEEDDCISPGYHTSLPMEVHGSCYSEMQMISQASYQQLHCASVVVTQHSFDLEAFTYYAITALCQKNHKTYEIFYDWAYELISVCPLSHTIVCLLMAHFSARDQLPATPTNCLNCLRKLDCAFHRRQFECRILFTWNMESGEWDVLDYGELMERNASNHVSPMKRASATVSLAKKAQKLAEEMSSSLDKVQDYTHNLRVLDSNVKRSKTALIDHDNMIEFTLKRAAANRD